MSTRPDPHWPVVSFWLGNARQNHILEGLAPGRVSGSQRVGLRAPKGFAAARNAQRSAVRQTKSTLFQWAQHKALAGQYSWLDAQMNGRTPFILACWNGIKGHRKLAMELARHHGHATLYMEEAPIKGRLALDFEGVNFGNSLPRQIAPYDQWATQWGGDLRAWRDLGDDLKARVPSRNRNVSQSVSDVGDAPFIFAPLQLGGDSQVTTYGDWIGDIDALIAALHAASEALPEGWHMRIKEHPSSPVSFTQHLQAMQNDRFQLDNNTDTITQIRRSKAVVTLNSAVGLEAFYFEKPVLVLGDAFYAFDQLATKVSGQGELAQLLSNPHALSFDAHSRAVFMSYLDAAYFPRELDVTEGRFRLEHLLARDADMARFVRETSYSETRTGC